MQVYFHKVLSFVVSGNEIKKNTKKYILTIHINMFPRNENETLSMYSGCVLIDNLPCQVPS